MLKKYNPSGKAPIVSEVKSKGASAPVTVPNKPTSTKGHVILTEAKGNGKVGVFTAPRKGDDMNPSASGYTKLKG